MIVKKFYWVCFIFGEETYRSELYNKEHECWKDLEKEAKEHVLSFLKEDQDINFTSVPNHYIKVSNDVVYKLLEYIENINDLKFKIGDTVKNLKTGQTGTIVDINDKNYMFYHLDYIFDPIDGFSIDSQNDWILIRE